ncbi:DUF402 domain-containing protein [Arthrobacter alpinus]|uniref:DUF402 domain-containing protein n=1 Tax=Arthrobacter alpinus TaxID=656366 RepID=UPI000ADB5D0B|nr:DUF402 domain-containing protein [Arthrobacter alpinus]
MTATKESVVLRRESEDPRPGDLVVARNRKYDGTAHWVVPGRYLGNDEFGHWIFQGTNEFISRPGAALYTESDAVLLIPFTGDWVATFYDESHPGGVELYIDLALDLQWRRIRPNVVEFHMIDMDLDVVRTASRGLYVDDEDEFAQHRVELSYPDELCTRMESACADLVAEVGAANAPFDGRDAAWFTLGRTSPSA